MVLMVLVVIQLVFGALLRHVEYGLQIHIALATLVVCLAIACGARGWGLYPNGQPMMRAGRALVILTLLQLGLGIAALIANGALMSAVADSPGKRPPPTNVQALLTTVHQSVGALLLACAVVLLLWARREPGVGEE